ncbi:MAG: DinB family protein [Phycisphaerales bacterium]|nr:MAG: DinB family protein [Phycisphaerales bacterium]
MATAKDVVRLQLDNAQKLMEMFTADLSDEEYFKPAAADTNHAAWIVGHIACSEDSLVSLITGGAKRIPDGTHALFGGESTCLPDASKYPSRKELDDMLLTACAHTLEALQTFDEGKWENPAPEGLPQEVFPSLGAVWGLLATHSWWHIGQLTTCRKVLGKKPQLT